MSTFQEVRINWWKATDVANPNIAHKHSVVSAEVASGNKWND